MDHDCYGVGAVYDFARIIVVLRRLGAKQKRIERANQCFAIACLMSILWMVVGYSLAFGDGGSMNAFIGGFDNVLLVGIGEGTASGTIPERVCSRYFK